MRFWKSGSLCFLRTLLGGSRLPPPSAPGARLLRALRATICSTQSPGRRANSPAAQTRAADFPPSGRQLGGCLELVQALSTFF